MKRRATLWTHTMFVWGFTSKWAPVIPSGALTLSRKSISYSVAVNRKLTLTCEWLTNSALWVYYIFHRINHFIQTGREMYCVRLLNVFATMVNGLNQTKLNETNAMEMQCSFPPVSVLVQNAPWLSSTMICHTHTKYTFTSVFWHRIKSHFSLK